MNSSSAHAVEPSDAGQHIQHASQAARTAADVVRVGVIGYGYWGPNIVRNFYGLENAEVVAVCDKNPAALRRVSRTYPGVDVSSTLSDVLRSPSIDVVAVVTP